MRPARREILAQAKATDAFNELEANALKKHFNGIDAAILGLLGAGGLEQSSARAKAAALEAASAKSTRPTETRLLAKAREHEHACDPRGTQNTAALSSPKQRLRSPCSHLIRDHRPRRDIDPRLGPTRRGQALCARRRLRAILRRRSQLSCAHRGSCATRCAMRMLSSLAAGKLVVYWQ